jgi:integrase
MHFSINKDSRGFRLFVTHTDGRRKSLRLGGMGVAGKREVDGLRQLLSALVAWKSAAVPLPESSQAVIAGLHPRLRSFLLDSALLSLPKGDPTVGEWLDVFLERKCGLVKSSTMRVYGRTCKQARHFFRPTERIGAVDGDRALEFRKWLMQPRGKRGRVLAEATIRKTCAIMSEAFGCALKAGLIRQNPFLTAGIKKTVQPNRSREYFVSREEAGRLLAACESTEERLMVGLARFAGLRTPSEIADLRWSDFDSVNRTLRIRSPKTAHHADGGIRKVPVFPILMDLLADQRVNSDQIEYLLPTLRRYPSLSTRMRRIIKDAGIHQYPRALHNLRLSCISEWVLVDRRDLVTVAEWAGHTIQIMTRHYLKQIHADSASQAALQAAGIGGAEVGLRRVVSGCVTAT